MASLAVSHAYVLPIASHQHHQKSTISSHELIQLPLALPLGLAPSPNPAFGNNPPLFAPTMNTFEAAAERSPPPQLAQRNARPSRIAARRPSAHVLPDFTFNPANSTSPPPSAPTPPDSPTSGPSSPPRPAGHKRGGSEFIGGDGSGGSGLLSASPTKSDAALPTPCATGRVGSAPGPRGHRHRRSAAISSHDLSFMLDSFGLRSGPRGASAPVSPLEGGHQTAQRSLQQRSRSSPSSPFDLPVSFATSSEDAGVSSAMKPPPRVRVGFSDKIEYIRPLSTVSCETESTLSTLRNGGHSLSNSISSNISASSVSPPSTRNISLSSRTNIEGMTATRPATAGSVLDKSDKEDSTVLGSGSATTALRPSSSGDSAAATSASSALCLNSSRPQAKGSTSFFRFERRRTNSPAAHAVIPQGQSRNVNPLDELPSSLAAFTPAVDAASAVDETNERYSRHRPWTGLITRKRKPQSPVANHSDDVLVMPATQPDDLDQRQFPDHLTDIFVPDFDYDNTVTIVCQSKASANLEPLEEYQSVGRISQRPDPDSDCVSPVIDLDVAIKPFHNRLDGTSQKSFVKSPMGACGRRMSSSGLSATGTRAQSRSHRRAESCPELVPFDYRPAVLAGKYTMADVFEEDEEDEEEDRLKPAPVLSFLVTKQPDRSAADSRLMSVADREAADSTFTVDEGLRIQPPTKGESEGEHSSVGSQSAQTTEGLCERDFGLDTICPNMATDLEAHEAAFPVTNERPQLPNLVLHETGKEEKSIFIADSARSPSMTPYSTAPSSFPSSAFTSSQHSLDLPRLGTAASSMTDYRVHLIGTGDLLTDLRKSDDVPSLTSSGSIATNALRNSLPIIRPGQLDESDRRYSFSQSVHSEGWRKRTSIVSLSRLIGGPSAEKSKLSIEHRPQSARSEMVTEVRSKRKQRFSRLVRFWKPKEPLRA